MKRIYYLTLGLIGLGFIQPVKAQNLMHPNIVTLSWEMSFPSTNGYIKKTSFAGGRFEYRKMVTDNLSIGAAMSWNSFEDYVGTKTYQDGNGGAVTTDMVRTIYTLPVTATVHYYPTLSNKMIRPYIGVGIGGQYSEQDSYFNIYQLSANNWGFVVRPEVGLILRVGREFGVLLAGSYNFATNKNKEFNLDNLSQWGINIGGAWVF